MQVEKAIEENITVLMGVLSETVIQQAIN